MNDAELVQKFGDAATDVFDQMLKGTWLDDHWHPVKNNTSMIKLADAVRLAIIHRETTFQQRVVQEKQDLDTKITALDKFMQGEVFQNLPSAEHSRMCRQHYFMVEYSTVLNERIKAFGE